jgi:hypothetical protein
MMMILGIIWVFEHLDNFSDENDRKKLLYFDKLLFFLVLLMVFFYSLAFYQEIYPLIIYYLNQI